MKNAKNSFISVCLISILILLPITATAQPQVLFSDDFEQYEVGKIIDESKWSMDDGIRWTPEAALDPTDESQTNQILKIYRDTTQTGNQAIAMDLGAQTDLVEISYRFYAPTDIENYNQAGNKASYFIINNSENKNIFYLGMDYGIGSNKRVRISGDGTELYPYPLYESANDTWHDIKVLMNPADQSYTFFLDNVMQESYPFRGMATLNNFDVSSVRFYPDRAITSNMLYLDDVYAKSISYSEGVETDYNWLTLENISNITDDLSLPSRGGIYASSIEWSSSNPSVISNEGTVSRQQTDTEVKLTAVLTLGEEILEKEFTVTVKALESGDDLLALIQEKLDSSMLTNEISYAITENLDLSLPELSLYSDSLTIEWSSDNPAVIIDSSAQTAVVTRQSEDVPFTLTAEIYAESASAPVEKEFHFVLWSNASEPCLTETFCYPDSIGQTIVEATGNSAWYFDRTDHLSLATAVIEQDQSNPNNQVLLLKRMTANTSLNNYLNYNFSSTSQLHNISVIEAKMKFSHSAGLNARYCFDVTQRGILPDGSTSSLQSPVAISFDYNKNCIWSPRVNPEDPSGAYLVEKNGLISEELPPADTWFTVKIVIDIPNEMWDLYIDGKKLNSEPIPFMTTGNQMAGIEGITYPYLSSLRFGPIRQVAGQNFYLDDLAVRNIANFSDDVNLAAAAIQIPEVTNENLSLPLSGAYGTTISWETSEEKIITKDGVITRPIGWNDAEVTLTATVSKGGINTTRNFDVTVEKLYPTEIQAIILKDKNGDLTYSMTSSGSLDKVLIKNNAALSGNVAAAIYDGDMLTDIKVMRNTDGLIEFGMNLPQEITNSTIKIFVWEDLSQMIPRAIPAVLTPVNAGKEKIKIYTIGDSTMATAAGKQAGWGEVLGAYFDPAKAEVDNSYSIGGASSKSSADTGRLNAMLGQLEPGDYVIIQFGHNDQKTEEPNNYTTPEDGGTYQQYLKRYINGVRAKGAYPVLATSICRRAFSNGVFTNTLGDYPRSMKALAEQLSVPLLDLNTKTEAALMEIGEQNSANYFMVANNDNTHLTEAGANWICTLAVEEMYRIGLPLTNCLAA